MTVDRVSSKTMKEGSRSHVSNKPIKSKSIFNDSQITVGKKGEKRKSHVNRAGTG
jgi:hypothetical protein